MPIKGSINPHLWKYKINTDFFKKPNSKMAYILGFTLADGRLEKSNLSFNLGRDKELLERINGVMRSNYPIKKERDSFRLRISNPIIIQDLQKLGLKFGKMKNNSIPNIPSRFFRDFIRGYFDGDGWVTANKEEMEISIGFSSGNREFLKDLMTELNKNLSINVNNLRKRKKITKNNKISTCYQIEYYSNNAYKIIRYLYDDLKENDLFLFRKYRKQIKARKIYEDLTRGTKLWRRIEDKYKKPMKEILLHFYKEKDLNGVEIAKELKAHSSSVYRWLAKTGLRFPVPKQRKVVTIKCLICNRKIARYKGREVKYCSPACRPKARQTGKLVKCICCHQKTYRPKWWFKVNTKPFCSRKCLGEWQRMRINKNLLKRDKITGQFLPFNEEFISQK